MPRWRQDIETGEFIPIGSGHKISNAPNVRSDIAPYLSPLDGSVVSGRRAEREHNIRLGVSNDLDSLREQSARALAGKTETRQDKHERKLSIKDSIERAESSGFHRHKQYQD